MKTQSVLALTGLLLSTSAWAANPPTFDDLVLGPESNYGGAGSGVSTPFTSGDWSFEHSSDSFSWSGFSYTNQTDTTTPGFTNQFSAITGGGVHGSDNYAVSFVPLDFGSPTFDPIPQTASATGDAIDAVFDGLYVTNTTYAYLSMSDGDSFAKKFGGASGDDEDWFLLTINGYDSGNQLTGTVEFYLADFRFADNSQDYLIDDWTWVDLTGLGEIASLDFSLSSSDVGNFGMNTPSYFAIDVPEPTTGLLLLAGLAAATRRRGQLI